MLVADEIIFSGAQTEKIQSEPEDVKLLLAVIHQKGLISETDYRRALAVAAGMCAKA